MSWSGGRANIKQCRKPRDGLLLVSSGRRFGLYDAVEACLQPGDFVGCQVSRQFRPALKLISTGCVKIRGCACQVYRSVGQAHHGNLKISGLHYG